MEGEEDGTGEEDFFPTPSCLIKAKGFFLNGSNGLLIIDPSCFMNSFTCGASMIDDYRIADYKERLTFKRIMIAADDSTRGKLN